ncbi:unnamed protein product [Dimorphilus gyrociliatus]|uniref:Uncharacterized protein n=1 Tax=Dimorphilus gyrociliatus TaxID=2664684 RepID=A0A7I8VC59_9ANNE|nr:unnamed protein product [Dimorphilus gyrociliatus]
MTTLTFILEQCSSSNCKRIKRCCVIIYGVCCLSTAMIWLSSLIEAAVYFWDRMAVKRGRSNVVLQFGFSLALMSSALSFLLAVLHSKKKSLLIALLRDSKRATALAAFSVFNYPRKAIVHQFVPEIVSTDLKVKFIRYKWDKKSSRLGWTFFDTNRFLDALSSSNEDLPYQLYDSFAELKTSVDTTIFSVCLCGEYREICRHRQLSLLCDIHSRECNCSWQFFSSSDRRNCSWKKLEIQVDFCTSNSRATHTSRWSALELTFMNKFGFTFLTPFNYPKNINMTLIDYLQKQKDFRSRFKAMYVYIVESLIIRDNGLFLVNVLLAKLEDKQHRKMVRECVTCLIFKEWPPPLWYLSLQRCRRFLRYGGSLESISTNGHIPEMIQLFVADPYNNSEIFDIFSTLSLWHVYEWTYKPLRFGIFECIEL